VSETVVMILVGIVISGAALVGVGCVILGLLGELRQNWTTKRQRRA